MVGSAGVGCEGIPLLLWQGRRLACVCVLEHALRLLDNMVFEEEERGPPDELRLQFEAISEFTPEEKEVARTVLESLILRHTANRFSRSPQQASS